MSRGEFQLRMGLTPLMFFEAVDRGNVGMVQRGKQFCFSFKACESITILRKLFRQRSRS